MANYTYGTKAVCPFYVREAQKSITCEGLIAGTHATIRFASAEARARFQAGGCQRRDYEARCAVARALMKSYEAK